MRTHSRRIERRRRLTVAEDAVSQPVQRLPHRLRDLAQYRREEAPREEEDGREAQRGDALGGEPPEELAGCRLLLKLLDVVVKLPLFRLERLGGKIGVSAGV